MHLYETLACYLKAGAGTNQNLGKQIFIWTAVTALDAHVKFLVGCFWDGRMGMFFTPDEQIASVPAVAWIAVFSPVS